MQATNVDALQALHYVKNFKLEVFKVRSDCDNMHMSECGINLRRPDSFLERRRKAKEICDVITSQCVERFHFTGHLEASSLLNPSKFIQYKCQFPLAVLDRTVFFYPCLAKPELKHELEFLYKREDLGSFKSLTELLHLLLTLNLTEAFGEVTKLIKILITTPMTTAESERNFSTLKRIKIFLQNTMLNDRLTALSMLSIESVLISQIKDFNKRVTDVFANAKNRRIELIFK